ncbi:hypothetical protein AK88_00288 [Plasmodium fragile]|uniref:Uncharacterized protein n=1 Tax=Plasmodium fragile TaxID=5857 RepID=A0A0D9QSV5_PLAFR|nr:uncharacterized protein AK88_00288 [Plasmodium fragile]KJP90119.1 hypothetical protein AK88_00288 [Plasmodium fragile]
MKILLSSDEVNLIVYRYLVENGFIHAAYAFFNEANISKNSYYISHDEKLPCHALVTFLQKALVFIFIEYHTEYNNARISCREPFSLFRRHECCTEAQDLSEEQENKTEILENEKNTSNNLNICTSSSKTIGNNNNNKSYLPNGVSLSDLKNDPCINNVNDHDPKGANAKKNAVSKKGGAKADKEEENGKANEDSNKNVNQVGDGNGKDTNNNSNNNTNDNNATKAKTNSKPSIYRSSFSNFASLNYNDSNISFKDIKRNYANIFAQGKKSKKSSSSKKNNSSNNSSSNKVNNDKNSEAASGHNNNAGGSSKKNGTAASSNKTEEKESKEKYEPDDISSSGNQRKKSKVMKIVSTSSKANEDQNGKCNNISDSILSDDKGKEHNDVSYMKEDNVQPNKQNNAKKDNNVNNNIKKNNVNTSSGKGTSLINNNNHSNGKKKELSGGSAGQNSSSSNNKKKKMIKESTSTNSTNNSKKTIKNSLKKEKNEKVNKSVTSKQKKNNRQDEDDEDGDDEVSDENSEEDSEFSNDNQDYNNENVCNAPLKGSTNNSAHTRDNPSSSSINNNVTVDDKTNDDTYVNFKKSSSTNVISNSSSQNSTIDGAKNEINNSHITHYDGNIQDYALASEKSLNGNHSKDKAMLKGECDPPEVEAKEGINSNKNEFNFSFANFLNKKISSIFNSSCDNDALNGDSHNTDRNNESCKGNSNDSTVKDGSNNEQVLPHDEEDPPPSEPYESVNNSKDRYNKFSQKSKLIKAEYMEAKYEKEHLAREQTNQAEDAAGATGDVGAPARKQKRPYDYNSDMKVQGGGDSHQIEGHENDKICVEEKKRKKYSIYEENYKNEVNKEFFKKLTQTSAMKGDNKCKGNGAVGMKEEKEDGHGRGVEQEGVDGELGGAESGDLQHHGDDGNAELVKAKVSGHNEISFNKFGKNYYNRSPSTANGDDHEAYDMMDKSPLGEENFLITNEKQNSTHVHTAVEVDEERTKN